MQVALEGIAGIEWVEAVAAKTYAGVDICVYESMSMYHDRVCESLHEACVYACLYVCIYVCKYLYVPIMCSCMRNVYLHMHAWTYTH